MVPSVAGRNCALLLLLGMSYCAVAQEEVTSAFVTVAVSDTLGGAIPNARVYVLQRLSNNETEKLTDQTGNATLRLQPGKFDLTVTGPPGFLESVITDLDVKPGEHRRMNVVLKVKTSDCCIDFVDERIEQESAKFGNLEEPSEQVTAQESLRKFLQNYASGSDYPDIKATRYFAALVYLRDDNTQQVIVYLMGRAWCGTGGCTTLILVPKGSSYTVITKMTVVQWPIRVLDTKSNGWHDLGVWVQGGGIQPGYEARLSFYGKKYPSNPTVPPAQPLTAKVSGKVVVPRSAAGEPLYPAAQK